MGLFSRRRRPPRQAVRGRLRDDSQTPNIPIGKPVYVDPTPKVARDSAKADPIRKQMSLKGLDYRPKYPFSKASLARLANTTPRQIDLWMTIADHWDVSIIETYRTPERQLALYNQGPHVTKVKFGKHNTMPSEAVDAAPYPIDWNDTDQFIRFTYFVKGVAAEKGYAIRNGADWDNDNDYEDHSFLDWVHWEEL